MKGWKSCRFWLAVCLILCLISGLGASAVTTNGGKVHVEKLTWLTEQGYTMSGLLYVPDNATAETPAPAVVTVHGWYNANGFQDLFDIELARRPPHSMPRRVDWCPCQSCPQRTGAISPAPFSEDFPLRKRRVPGRWLPPGHPPAEPAGS